MGSEGPGGVAKATFATLKVVKVAFTTSGAGTPAGEHDTYALPLNTHRHAGQE